MGEDKVIPVRVALRSRPLVTKEIVEGCQLSLQFVPGEPQVILGRDKAFTFDCAFSPETSQKEVYSVAVADRIEYLFKGYNVTVLAYGQTGSGKTYTMGTSYSSSLADEMDGIIQRCVQDIFAGINQRSQSEFLIKVSFLEIYKEDVFDLLQKRDAPIAIREDYDGGIKVVGLTEQPVTSPEETLQTLEQGSLSRTTASTAMNARSSRSHAIFTIIVEQRNASDGSDLIRAKFHLVDLAGSERANKTGALGERFKEGVNINKGLLALGNVISSLCDEASHVPYRDSKLTRLLQDSLGGNSHTVMIACVSPADSNLDETLNTLRYADRARKIKNKPIVNRDPQNAELMKLRQQVQQLQIQLLQYQTINDGGELTRSSKEIGSDDAKILLERNKHLEDENRRLAKELQYSLDQTTTLCEKALLAEMSKEKLVQKLEELKEKTAQTVEALSTCLDVENNSHLQEQLNLVKELQNKIIDLQCEQIRKDEEFSLYSPSKSKQVDDTNVEESSYSLIKEENTSTGKDGAEIATEADESFHLESTLKQAAMGRELQELERALALKEDLALRMRESDSQLTVMRLQYENSLKQMEDEINNLQKEKEELSTALKAVHSSANATKVSEQRRKRLQELEAQISQLKKQMQEKSRMIKIKQEAERKVTSLQQEIQGMKQARVKLLRQMKEEAERYRIWKAQKDREVAQLKQQERKRQFQMAKMEQQYTKQHTVLKRKMEEAVAANKRLQVALHQQKTVAERRLKEKEHSMHGIGSRVKQWLSQEIEVVVSSKEAEHHLHNLLEDRKTISEQLNNLRNWLDDSEPPHKKGSFSDSKDSEKDNTSDDEKNDVKERIELLEKELEIRNIQIADLQQKILDVDQDEKTRHRWDSIQVMVEAKCALKWLFDYAVSSKTEAFLKMSASIGEQDQIENQCNNYKTQVAKLTQTCEEQRKEMHQMKLDHEDRVASLVRENEDKTLYFLKQMFHSPSSSLNTGDEMEASLMEKIKFQENEISRLGYIHEELQRKANECEELKNQLAVARCKGVRASLMPLISSEVSTHRTSTKVVKSKEHDLLEALEDSYLSDDDNDENDENDPDWRLTPVFRRSKTLNRRTLGNMEKDASSTDSDASKTMKRSISGSVCKCQGSCATKRCSCHKQQKMCSNACKCSDTCINRESVENSLSSQGDTTESTHNATFSISTTKQDLSKRSQKILSEVNHKVPRNTSKESLSTIQEMKSDFETEKPFKFSRKEPSIIEESGILQKKQKLFKPHNASFFKPV